MQANVFGVCTTHTHIYTHNRFTALWILSGTTRVSWYQKKHSPTHTHRGHQSSYLLPPSTTIHGILPIQSTCFMSFSTISLQVFFGLPLGLAPPLHTPLFLHPIVIFFRNTCPYHRNLFCCSTEIVSSNPSLPLNSLLGTLSCNFTPHIHLTILISAL